MPSPSVTYTFSNSTTADAGQVNTNFSDLIAAMSDGTKDFSIAALTLAGALTANGNVTLGNATSDTITTTGRAASSYVPSASASYDFGSSSLGWASLYLGRNSQTVRLIPSSSASATYTMTLPPAAGTKGYVPYNSDGSATLTWVPAQTDIHSVSSADYTVLDDDGYGLIEVTTSTTDRTITLPTAADNTDRVIKIKKMDSATGVVIIDGEGAETIDGTTVIYLPGQYDAVELKCNGTGWDITGSWIQPFTYRHGTNYLSTSAPTITATTSVSSVQGSSFVPYKTANGGFRMTFNFKVTLSGNATSNTYSINAVTFKNSTGFRQSVSVYNVPAASAQGGYASPNTDDIVVTSSSADEFSISGDVELESKPTWAYLW